MSTYYGPGDALKADRIAVQARNIDTPYIVKGSGKHRTQSTKLRDSAFCVIELPLKSVRERGSRT